MKAQILIAQNSTTAPIVLNREKSMVLVLGTNADTPATAEIAVQIELFADEWLTIEGIVDGVDALPVASVIGPSQWGWVDVPGAQRARLIRLDANGGNAGVGIEQVGI